MSGLQFHVKEICWSPYEQNSPILLQEKNGPCPLIAIVNTLILTSDIDKRTVGMEDGAQGETITAELAEHAEMVASSSSETQHKLRSRRPRLDVSSLRSLLNKHIGGTVNSSSILSCLGDLLLDLSIPIDTHVLTRVLDNLPLLHTGLDVNPNLVTGRFDDTELASQMFSAFSLNFVHGWCRDVSGGSRVDAVFTKFETFDALQEFLLTSPEEPSVTHPVEAWIHENATQLTDPGLHLIDKHMAADSLAVFFRNNHFSTLYKAQNHDLYLLITDEAFLKHKHYVWQSINSVSGKDDLFFSGDFTPLMDGFDSAEIDHVDENLIYAKQLQEKEDSDYAKILQKYEKQRERSPKSAGDGKSQKNKVTGKTTRGNKDSGKRKKEDKVSGKKESCVVI
ncbi:hypothetical protein JCM33374_g2345 [Metschnikowia sp. JCM 33374]|nr:hypothetical protein JCM33374_g2345 [Metschnikowia sp. JCM 33374]